LGERLLCKQEVIGSIPFTSTTVARPPAAAPLSLRAAVCAMFGEEQETPSGARLAPGRSAD
jgi:hypothetical protein